MQSAPQASSRLRDFVEAVKTPTQMVVGTRLVLFWIAYLGLTWVSARHHRAISSVPENLFLDGWFHWDAHWYKGLILNGYTNVPYEAGQRDTVFFPLFPLLVRAVSQLTGDIFSAAIIVSNGSLLAGTVMFFRFVKERFSEPLAIKATALLLLYPFSFYFSGMYTEGLFFLGNMGAFYFAHRKNWLVSGLFLAAASATRTVGILTTGAVFLFYLQEIGWDLKKVRPNVLFLALGGLGIGSFMAFLYFKFGDALLFTTNLNVRGWGADMTPARFWEAFTEPFYCVSIVKGQLTWSNVFATYTLVITAVLILTNLKRLGVPFAVWSIALWFVYFRVWTGSGRFFSVHFPFFLLVASLLDERPKWLAFVTFASGSMLIFFTFVHSHGFWVS